METMDTNSLAECGHIVPAEHTVDQIAECLDLQAFRKTGLRCRFCGVVCGATLGKLPCPMSRRHEWQ